MTAARTLAAELRAALAVRRRSGKWLGDAVGMSHSTVYDILRHSRVPTVPTAQLLADALDWPKLVTIAVERRTKRCEVCGGSFVDAGRNCIARCCSPECQNTRYARKRRGVEVTSLRGRAEVAENRLERMQHLVAAFCGECTQGDAACRTPDCILRPVSPIPLIQLSSVSRRKVA